MRSLLRMITCRPRRAAGLVAMVLLLSSLLTLAPVKAPVAQAIEGRSTNPILEVIAYYEHFLGRGPDSAGMLTYVKLVVADCRTGVLESARAIATSPEGQRYLNSPDRKANSIYAGMLNRLPDDKGWHDHELALSRGLAWDQDVLNVLYGPEYQQRLVSICQVWDATPLADCRSIAAQGPPSASIPWTEQPYLNCYGGGAISLSDCQEEILAAALGVGATGVDAKFILKKVGPAGAIVTGGDVAKAYFTCS